jgi:hypothetical protein
MEVARVGAGDLLGIILLRTKYCSLVVLLMRKTCDSGEMELVYRHPTRTSLVVASENTEVYEVIPPRLCKFAFCYLRLILLAWMDTGVSRSV